MMLDPISVEEMNIRRDELRQLGLRFIAIADSLDQPSGPLDAYVRKTERRTDELLTLVDCRLADLARSLLELRTCRTRWLPESYFGEPAWDMLLDLFVNAVGKRTVHTKSVCVAANAPRTTGLRWLNTLEKDGLVERCPSAKDSRAVEVSLTEKGLGSMRSLLAECVGSASKISCSTAL